MYDLGSNQEWEAAPPVVTRTLLHDERETPLGQLRTAGYIKDSPGVSLRRKRVLGRYAVVLLLEGSGVYEDSGETREVSPGDLLLLFPELAHGYGPRANEHWSELFVVFDGASFDLLRNSGVFSPAQPIVHAGIDWRDALESAVCLPDAPSPAAKVVQTSRFLYLLTEMLASQAVFASEPAEPEWLGAARSLLGENLSEPVAPADVARQVGMSYETFRKRFEEHTGAAPARYRMNRRIDAAAAMLRYTRTPIRQIAESLGFSDEFHLSNRFQQKTGVRPSEYRLRRSSDDDLQ